MISIDLRFDLAAADLSELRRLMSSTSLLLGTPISRSRSHPPELSYSLSTFQRAGAPSISWREAATDFCSRTSSQNYCPCCLVELDQFRPMAHEQPLENLRWRLMESSRRRRTMLFAGIALLPTRQAQRLRKSALQPTPTKD